MIRKYATALTRTGTLSFVITSCGGIFSVIVRRSTLTMRSIIGIRMNQPGPFGGSRSRPSLKMTPRSYSRAILIAAAPARARSRGRRRPRSRACPRVDPRPAGAALAQRPTPGARPRRPWMSSTATRSPTSERLPVLGDGLPQLAVDEDEPIAPRDTCGADHGRRTDRDRSASRLQDLGERERRRTASAPAIASSSGSETW